MGLDALTLGSGPLVLLLFLPPLPSVLYSFNSPLLLDFRADISGLAVCCSASRLVTSDRESLPRYGVVTDLVTDDHESRPTHGDVGYSAESIRPRLLCSSFMSAAS